MYNKRPYDGRNAQDGAHKRPKLENARPGTRHLAPRPPPFGAPNNLPPLPAISPELEAQVFTHSTALANTANLTKIHLCYERLEVLGDAYLETVAIRILWARYPHYAAGQLSQHRELLIKNETLAAFSQAYGFDRRLKVGQATATTAKDKAWVKIMGDVMEAYVAAVVLTNGRQGFEVVENWLGQLWVALIEEPLVPGTALLPLTLPESKAPIAQKPVTEKPETQYDPLAKQTLARQIMSKGIKIEYLEYAPTESIKKEGKTIYSIACYLTGWGYLKKQLGCGQGLSKAEAGGKAATQALENDAVPTIMAMKKGFDLKSEEYRERADEEAAKAGEEVKERKVAPELTAMRKGYEMRKYQESAD